MTGINTPRPGRESADGVGALAGRRVGRRDRVEAAGLLLGILGVLVVVAVTVGAGPSP
jgi:hypothetical protein